MKVYISGPIRGYENGNRAAFAQAAEELRKMGHEPVNPHDVDKDHCGPCLGDDAGEGNPHRYGCYMIPDLRALLDCSGYTLLPGWQRSRGAKVERDVAKICGLKFVAIQYGSMRSGMLR